jgi:glycosyltransferase involved in cell wall biosynthesis
MRAPEAVFIVNLLQDVNILRPLVFLARGLGMAPRLVVMNAFDGRDTRGTWRAEIEEIARAGGASVQRFSHASEAVATLRGGGIVVAGSESNLEAHRASHDVLRCAPRSYVTVTLQHGFECVGFLQSRNHSRAHGDEVTFAADVLCGWSPLERLTSLAASQRAKLLVTGPTALLQQPPAGPKSGRGLVCENLHSVRFSSAGDFKADFTHVFGGFCADQATRDRSVVLRPHPGGQYVLKHNVPLPSNVVLNNNPIYKVDLSKYAFGISAPSSIIIDMLLARIPTAVWVDQGRGVDAGNYEGLTLISSPEDWIAFAREAEADPAPFLARQEAFLAAQELQCDPAVARRGFTELLAAAACLVRRSPPARGADSHRGKRVLIVANDSLPTLQICFVSPLAGDVSAGAIEIELLTEAEIKKAFPSAPESTEAEAWALGRMAEYAPDLVVFCRYSGPHARALAAWARGHAVPTIFHIDDDLLAVPQELGEGKFRHHNSPQRTETIRFLVANADVLYCVNPILHDRLKPLRGDKASHVGKIAGPGAVVRPPPPGPVRRIGYMGMSHAHDLEPLVPVIGELLRRRPDVEFHLFGSTPKPSAWESFGSRIVVTPPAAEYAAFRATFAALEWGIGIAPLLKIPFNLGKTNLKWVDYTSVGTAVIASRGTLYDECCGDGCGILAEAPEEWLAAMEFLLDHPEERVAQVRRAQQRLLDHFSAEALRRQVLDVFALAGDPTRSAPRSVDGGRGAHAGDGGGAG